MPQAYDVVVIGGGHNGLVTAAYLGVAWAVRRRWPGVAIAMVAFFVIVLPMLGPVQNGNVIALSATFEQHCEGATPALHGTIHYFA